jgi:hypothetical protein
MSEMLFETLSKEEYLEQGGAGSAERGLYARVLAAFADSGERYAAIPTDRGPFEGKVASSISTALKTARGSKSAPDAWEHIKITSKGGNKEKGIAGVVFLENAAVA